MTLYSERNGIRQPVQKDNIITVEKYEMLFDCCEQYLVYLAWLIPLKDKNGNIVNYDRLNFEKIMEIKIPSLYRTGEGIAVPRPQCNVFAGMTKPEYDQIALLDYIEFIACNIHDLIIDDPSCTPYYFSTNTHNKRDAFREEINNIFDLTNLLYWMNEDCEIERIPDVAVLSESIENQINNVQENVQELDLAKLLTDATHKYKSHDPEEQKDAVEKLWDAFERMKTYYSHLDKKQSVDKIIFDMSNGDPNFKDLLEAEFRALTNIGNNYRIRHHETNRINIADQRFYDYFFNRCLSLIATAITFLDPYEYQNGISADDDQKRCFNIDEANSKWYGRAKLKRRFIIE